MPPTSHENPVRAANLGQMRLAESSIRRLASSLPFDPAGILSMDDGWRVGHGGSAAKHKIAHQPRDKCSRLRVLNHSRPMAIPPINAGGRPAWLLGPGGAAVVGAPAIRCHEPPGARWKPSQQNLFQKKQIFRLPTTPPRMCRFHVALRRRNVGIHCSDGDGDVIKRTRPADYRTIYCVPIILSVVSAGT